MEPVSRIIFSKNEFLILGKICNDREGGFYFGVDTLKLQKCKCIRYCNYTIEEIR